MSMYKPRLIDKQIESSLKAYGAINIVGTKWIGKTWAGRKHSNSEFLLMDPTGNYQNKRLAETDISLIFEGSTPKLIDEWQEVPEIWDATRYKCDEDGVKGKYILTDSTVLSENEKAKIKHSGAGRIKKLKMYPMSLYESGDSSGDVSLKDIYNNKVESKKTREINLKDIIKLVLRGGFPGSIDIPFDEAIKLPKEYVKEIINTDIDRISNKKRDLNKVMLLLRSLARNESTTTSVAKLKDDIKGLNNEDIDIKTITLYLEDLSKLYLIENQLPFNSNIRSSMRVKQSQKRHFVDPSIATSLLNMTVDKCINDLLTFGFFFEAMVERDLRIYAEANNWNLFHYQDYSGNEFDAVVEFDDGEYAAFEIKLGANQIEDAANNLIKVSNIIKEKGGIPPKSLCVICGLSNAVYTRSDGVIVIPITALKD